MAKLTNKEKQELKEKQRRYERGYKDYWFLLLITVVVWVLESPAVFGLLTSESRQHFYAYGVGIIIASTVGFLLSVLLLALDKRRASIIVSCVSAGIILIICALVYAGYNRALNTSNLMVMQIITSYITPVAVPVANIIMVNRRI